MTNRLITAVALALLAASCSTGEGDPTPTEAPIVVDATSAPKVDTIAVELGEWSVLPEPDGARAGELMFEVTNSGQEPHELVIAETDLEAGDLPTLDDGSVDEEELDIVGEVEDVEQDEDGELEVDLEQGTYVLFCNVVDEDHGHVHYKLGMRTSFQVS